MDNCYNALWCCGPERHPSLAAPSVSPVSGGTSQKRWQHTESRWQARGWLRSHCCHPPPAEIIHRCTPASHFKPQSPKWACNQGTHIWLKGNLSYYNSANWKKKKVLSYSPCFQWTWYLLSDKCKEMQEESDYSFAYTRFPHLPCSYPHNDTNYSHGLF